MKWDAARYEYEAKTAIAAGVYIPLGALIYWMGGWWLVLAMSLFWFAVGVVFTYRSISASPGAQTDG
jgi:hypothetical protein